MCDGSDVGFAIDGTFYEPYMLEPYKSTTRAVSLVQFSRASFSPNGRKLRLSWLRVTALTIYPPNLYVHFTFSLELTLAFFSTNHANISMTYSNKIAITSTAYRDDIALSNYEFGAVMHINVSIWGLVLPGHQRTRGDHQEHRVCYRGLCLQEGLDHPRAAGLPYREARGRHRVRSCRSCRRRSAK